MFDTEKLAALDLRTKDVLDENVSSCDCNDGKTFKWINKMLIVRKGISYDLQANDDDGATVKLNLLETMLDSGADFNCGCN